MLWNREHAEVYFSISPLVDTSLGLSLGAFFVHCDEYCFALAALDYINSSTHEHIDPDRPMMALLSWRSLGLLIYCSVSYAARNSKYELGPSCLKVRQGSVFEHPIICLSQQYETFSHLIRKRNGYRAELHKRHLNAPYILGLFYLQAFPHLFTHLYPLDFSTSLRLNFCTMSYMVTANITHEDILIIRTVDWISKTMSRLMLYACYIVAIFYLQQLLPLPIHENFWYAPALFQIVTSLAVYLLYTACCSSQWLSGKGFGRLTSAFVRAVRPRETIVDASIA